MADIEKSYDNLRHSRAVSRPAQDEGQFPSLPISDTQTPRSYSPAIAEILSNLYYRQSMINDYLTCPQMMMYKWIIQHEEEDTFMAGILGTAGHKVIQEMHEKRNFDFSYAELLTMFCEAFQEAVKSSNVPPKVGQQYRTLTAQMNAVAPDYVTLLRGYQKDQLNREFHSTMVEQMFVLELKDEFDRIYIITGTIDQGGYYQDGMFSLRDIKFRANNFKPGRIQIKLDLQLTIYAYALQYGKPACHACLPKYTDLTSDEPGTLIYEGPCDDCAAKIGTPQWPNLHAEQCEIIWMRDYEVHKKDQYAKYITSDTEKVLNPKTGRMIKKKITNPAWLQGYKEGENKGPGRIVTNRSPAFLQVHISDVLKIMGMIRDGRFYRKPGEHCNFWCKFKEPCIGMLETQVEEIDTVQINSNMATIDPFAD